MFKAGQTNPYDDIVVKATDENSTSENWEVILNLCDKVQEERELGARNVIASVNKRLAHRSPNVQLYALSLAESLSKNCGIDLHHELASRAFTQALEKLITDRTTHDKVRKRALTLIALWTAEFEKDPSLGVMEECYDNLKAKNYQFEPPDEPAPLTVDDEVRRREEEELQRALEMSMHDKGGRTGYVKYSAHSSGANGSSSGAGAGPSTSSVGESTHSSGYVPAQSPQTLQKAAASSTSSLPSQSVAPSAPTSAPIVTRVKALYAFEPTEPGELAFEKGDIIKVVDRGYKDWWRGQLKGRTGIFPVNYVEPLPEPTASELAREAEQEASVFAQAANVDKLLTMLRAIDASEENLADNEEIQELYRSCMSLRPKIVKLIDKYSQKRADLVSMNESFVKARVIFDRMMEDSLARPAGMYDVGPRPDYSHGQAPYARQEYGPQPPYGYPAATPGFDPQVPQQQSPYGYVTSTGYPESSYPQQHGDPGYGAGQGYVPGATQPYGGSVPQPVGSPYPQQEPQPQPRSQVPPQSQLQSQPQPQLQPHSQPQPQPQPQFQPHPQPHQQQQYHTPAADVTQAAQPQGQSQAAPEQSGPPYVYDPHTTYADPNVQAWAQYYVQGGKDPAGAVYFFSVPGVTDVPPDASPQGSAHPEQASTQLQGSHQPKLLLNPKRCLSRAILANHPISSLVLPYHSLKDNMRITLILLVLRSYRRRRLGQAPRTAIPLLRLLHNHRRAMDLCTVEDRAVGTGMVMFHLQYMDRDQGMTTELKRYNISSRRWVLGLGRQYSNTRTL
ncbi:hypothetical protein JVT61DRAFT_4170 [Boletus reticuloceps]|uniref:Class E vacuolar protein-sorting machinery protein HSE1 n=1 Tax=Boletus reticuloceps TaxID=495285 RepID=A0A8I2YNL3_9AGAM|nr:hypothetical protein JVT61DRAFT_4170 [Boletus reticuloceps]